MNIFGIITTIVSLILADAATIEALIAAKNWSGLTENLLQLVEEAVASFSTKVATSEQKAAALKQ